MYMGIGTDAMVEPAPSVPHHNKVPLNAREPTWDAREVLQRCLLDARYRGTPVAQVPVEVLEALLLLLSLPPEVDLGG